MKKAMILILFSFVTLFFSCVMDVQIEEPTNYESDGSSQFDEYGIKFEYENDEGYIEHGYMKIDKKIRLSGKVTPISSATFCQWSSEHEDIAEIDANGYITAKKIGNTVITFEAKNNTSIYDQLKLTILSNYTN
jgi:Bacterial Ig-like domain (group 2)